MDNYGFPQDFLWGAATAAHQVEGGNVGNDWWTFEHSSSSGCKESSGDACDSWNRWQQDVDLIASLGLNTYRFSLEWSRIEPEEDEWSKAAVQHYRRICTACLERGITPMVTFHHFTTPRWLADRGGWEASDAPERFARFCAKAVAGLGDVIGWACTINEPNIVAMMGYLLAAFPPGISDEPRHKLVSAALCRAHHLAVEALRSGPGDFPIGLSVSMIDYQAQEGGEECRDQTWYPMEDAFLHAATGDDFLGVQTYTRLRIGPKGLLGNEPGVPLTDMGYERWPEALEATIRRAHQVTNGMRIVITEHGIATTDDAVRIQYTSAGLQGIKRCLDDGIDVCGYVHWSLLDNFEWTEGYRPRFGLVEVDRSTFERKSKPSAAWLGSVARSNGKGIT